MRIGAYSYLTTSALAVAIAFVAKDFTAPLLVIALMGLFDRLIAQPALRGR